MDRKGFTLAEIMIVLAIIGLLVTAALPSFVLARVNSRTGACLNNLRLIEAAKEEWAMATNAADNAVTTDNDITPYLAGRKMPTCRGGGTYTTNPLNTKASCSIGGAHTL